MQPARLKRTTSHLVPHLGGVGASIGTFSRASVYTYWHVGVPVLWNCGATYVFEPLVSQPVRWPNKIVNRSSTTIIETSDSNIF